MREVIDNRNESSACLDMVLVLENYLDIVEAKWLEFNPIQKLPIMRISDKVKSACEDALSYKNNEILFSLHKKTIRKVGLTFAIPHFSSNDIFDNELILSLIEKIKNTVFPDILA